jgi:hypothetical protein
MTAPTLASSGRVSGTNRRDDAMPTRPHNRRHPLAVSSVDGGPSAARAGCVGVVARPSHTAQFAGTRAVSGSTAPRPDWFGSTALAASAIHPTNCLTAARAEALFASDASASAPLSREQAVAAIRWSVRTHGGVRGCAAEMAAAYGKHPETAAPRMRWARTVVESLFTRSPGR